MGALLAELPAGPAVLESDDASWALAQARARDVLHRAAQGLADPPVPALAVAAGAARTGSELGEELLGCVRRALVRAPLGSETSLRCLRTLARVGARVDVALLSQLLSGAGRLPRLALTALAEAAWRDDERALESLVGALDGPLRADAAMLLSHVCGDEALDALGRHLRRPGRTGLHAAAGLLAAEDDAFAFEVLLERLCDPVESVAAARALWGAGPQGLWLRQAESMLGRWARRGVQAAEHGRFVAAVALAAGGLGDDLSATQRALGSEDDELVLLAAQAAFCLGDSERARAAAMHLLRRGPQLAAQAFAMLARWADLGDDESYTIVRGLLSQRPADLARGAVMDALVGTSRPPLHAPVLRALTRGDPGLALEASRALARLREPPSPVPPVWL